MNKAISEGLVLMPVPFSAGLNQWSRENGTPGSASYAGQANAAFVPSDQDFGGCLELEKTETTQKLRYMGETPLQPGLYLRVTTRIKAVALTFAEFVANTVDLPASVYRADPAAYATPMADPVGGY